MLIRPRKKFVSCNSTYKNRVGLSLNLFFGELFFCSKVCFMHDLW